MPTATTSKPKQKKRPSQPYIMLRMSKGEIAEVTKASKRDGMRYPAAWVRSVVLKAARRPR